MEKNTVRPFAPLYHPPDPTKMNLDYAHLPIIDLAKDASPESRLALAREARDAMREHGFLYAINHGLSKDQVERMFDIADVPFSHVSDQESRHSKEKWKRRARFRGTSLVDIGYALYLQVSFHSAQPPYWSGQHIDNGIKDQIETYNINRDVARCQHPAPLIPFLPEVGDFAHYTHKHILHPVLRLLAIGLELPEDTFVNLHGYSAEGETYVRFMKYYPYPEEEESKANNVWLKGHTDMGSMTILFSQPIAALQIMTKERTWKWVQHIDNAVVINIGDALEFLSGGYYKATIHRVVQPPPDQRALPRLGVYYFAMTDDDVNLVPVADSLILRRTGITYREGYDAQSEPPTMAAWRKARTAAYGRSELKPAEKEERMEEETFGGLVVKHYR